MTKAGKPKRSWTPLERHTFSEHQCPACGSIKLRATGGTRIKGSVRLRSTECECGKKFVMVLVKQFTDGR